jgi:uncharacterized membrane protein YGL010W
MRTLVEQLTMYANYHRDRRNIATHFVGIPMIVVSITALLARPSLDVAGFALTPLLVVATLSTLFYLALDVRFGLAMAAVLAGAGVLGMLIAAQPSSVWLAISIGLFIVGWIIQFVGHFFEGKKPAFVDDLVGLLIGPLFVTAEVAFALGLRREVHDEIVRRAGPTTIRTTTRVTAS